MKYVLALDQGSGSSKAALISPDGGIVHFASVPLRTFRGPGSRVEHRPDEILNTQRRALAAVLSRVRSRPARIEALGLAGQRSTLVLWDRTTGKPFGPAVSWQDLRAAGEVGSFAERRGRIRKKTGLLLSPYYSALKLRWILRKVPGARRKAESGHVLCGSVNSFLLWHWSRGGLHVVDPTQASRFLLLNLRTLAWDGELLEWFDIPDRMLPSVVPTVSDLGSIRILGENIPIRATVGDQQAALMGLGGAREGNVVVNYGTGGFVVTNTGARPASIPGLLTALAWNDGRSRTYEMEGPVNSVGSVLDWMLRFGLAESWNEMVRLSRKDGGDLIVIPAMAGLGAPHWIDGVRMSASGIGPETSRGDFIRGVLEGIAFRIRDVLDAIRSRPDLAAGKICVGGGVSRFDRLMQIQSDVLGRPLFRPAGTEATVTGAGWLAGIGAGWWKTARETPRPERGKWFRPETDLEDRYRRWRQVLRMELSSERKDRAKAGLSRPVRGRRAGRPPGSS